MIHHRKRPILYVDDTVEQRYAMRRILEIEGFNVLEAGTGREALSLMEQQPSLAVVDVRLPDVNGYVLARQMKAINPYLQLLQVSASFSDPNSRVEGFSGGADAYIAQPVHPSELVTLVRRMLKMSEAEEALRFLAGTGSRIGSSLSLPETVENISGAIIPYFANNCLFYLQEFPGKPSHFLPQTPETEELQSVMKRQCAENVVRMMHSRLLIAPLIAGSSVLGTMAFQLDTDREYTSSDLILAEDIAHRSALALHNCILFASEQLTRSALIQAEKLATAGRMAAAIAHEINNPLEALINLMYILENSSEGSPFIHQTAGTALSEVMRLAHITRQTLGFYRELRSPGLMNLSQCISEAVELYRTRLLTKQGKVELDSQSDIYINGIKGEIRQVISNLLVNAVDVIDSGGKISVRTWLHGNRAVFEVSDDGPGIPEELLGKIFEPFFTTKHGTGTGLGLWITRSIVEKHDGSIRVFSRHTVENHGTTFEVDLPAVSPNVER